jgi:predicted acyl esterase
MARLFALVACTCLFVTQSALGGAGVPASYIKEHYTRATHKIKMRDGTHLHTIVYSPKDQTQKYPILLLRTPYGIHPYEEDKHRATLGPNPHFIKEGYIFAYQDVRGRYMSEGTFVNMRPSFRRRAGRRTSTRARTPTTP